MSKSDALELALMNHLAGVSSMPAVAAISIDIIGNQTGAADPTSTVLEGDTETLASYSGYAALTPALSALTVSQVSGLAKIVVNAQQTFAAVPSGTTLTVHRFALHFFSDSGRTTKIGTVYSDTDLAGTIVGNNITQPVLPANTGFVYTED